MSSTTFQTAHQSSLILYLQGLTVVQRLALNDSAMTAAIELRQLFRQHNAPNGNASLK